MTAHELDELVRRFEACALPRPEWTHAAHLCVGLWHVCRYGPEAALARLRLGIRRLNESNGVVNSATSGYHETITRAYVAEARLGWVEPDVSPLALAAVFERGATHRAGLE